MAHPSFLLPRRRMLSGSIGLGCILIAGACKKSEPASCTSSVGLTPEEAQLRTTLAYSDRSPDAARACDACIQYVVPKEAGECGACKLMKGPIHPRGTCNVFAPKT